MLDARDIVRILRAFAVCLSALGNAVGGAAGNTVQIELGKLTALVNAKLTAPERSDLL